MNKFFTYLSLASALGVICSPLWVSDRIEAKATTLKKEIKEDIIESFRCDVQSMKRTQEQDHDMIIKIATKMNISKE